MKSRLVVDREVLRLCWQVSFVVLALVVFPSNVIAQKKSDKDSNQTVQENAQEKTKEKNEDYSAHMFMMQQDSRVFSLNGKSMTLEELKKRHPKKIYDLELKVYEEMQNIMRQQYFQSYFDDLARKSKKTSKEAQDSYFAQKVKENRKVIDERIENFIKNNPNHPELASKSKKEKREILRTSAEGQIHQEAVQNILMDAMRDGKMSFLLPPPMLPPIDFALYEDEYVRYGYRPEDESKSFGCEGDSCPVTVIEFQSFQCPACASALPITREVMKKYQGKIRWIIRDFPLSYQRRSRPAAVVAGCAYEQGKYWQMYHALFDNQRDLSDKTFVKLAKKFGIYNRQFKDCQAKSDKVEARIERNMQSGVSQDVNATPSFFVNGYFVEDRGVEGFSAMIEKELAKSGS